MSAEPTCLAEVQGKYLHESEMPATYGMQLCDCQGCRIALEATSADFDSTRVIVKYSDTPRRVLHWRTYCEMWDERERGGAHPFLPYMGGCAEPGTVIELFIMGGTGAPGCGCFTSIFCPKSRR